MRLTLSSFAISAAALTSLAYIAGAIVLFRSLPDEEEILLKVLAEQQRLLDEGAGVSRTVQVYLLGEGRISYANEEMTLATLASRVDLERWDDHTNVQVMLAGDQVGEDHVRLLELLGRRGVFHVRIQPPAREEKP